MTVDSPRKVLSPAKRLLFNAIMFAITLGTIEAIAWSAVYLRYGGLTTVSQARRKAYLKRHYETGNSQTNAVIHPYIGWALLPDKVPAAEGQLHATRYGFHDVGSPLHTRSPETLIVGVVGGSVAGELITTHWPKIARELTAGPEFQGKRVIPVRLALAGLKQPQQLMTVTWLLTLGAEFDVILNLDGYNEVALAPVENVPNRVSTAYPRNWRMQVRLAGDPKKVQAHGRMYYLRDLDRDFAAAFDRGWWRYSGVANLVWVARHDAIHDEMVRNFNIINDIGRVMSDYAANGPPESVTSPDEVSRRCAELWRNSSRQLHRLCRGNDILYVHCLQPNQYVPNSKKFFSPEEQSPRAASHMGAPWVIRGYPMLQQEARQLREEGVPYFDLTDIYLNEKGTIYRDPCCHVNDDGNVILARAVARAIRDSWRLHNTRRPGAEPAASAP